MTQYSDNYRPPSHTMERQMNYADLLTRWNTDEGKPYKGSLIEWAAFTDAEIRTMDGVKAVAWWTKWREWVFQTIEMCPARPTGYVAPDKGVKINEKE